MTSLLTGAKRSAKRFYNNRGSLDVRTDAKGAMTLYSYNKAGQLTNVNYETDTDVQYFLDNLGRTTQRVDSAGTSCRSLLSRQPASPSPSYHALGLRFEAFSEFSSFACASSCQRFLTPSRVIEA